METLVPNTSEVFSDTHHGPKMDQMWTFSCSSAPTHRERKRLSLFVPMAFWTRLKKSFVVLRLVRDKGDKTRQRKTQSTGLAELLNGQSLSFLDCAVVQLGLDYSAGW